ncbi:corrinoid protein [Desulforhopalus sp. 52FAK]
MSDFKAMSTALVACDEAELMNLVDSALASGVSAADILNKGLIGGMDIVGGKMESGEMFIPEVLMAAQSMANCVAVLKPLLGDSAVGAAGRVAIGTVKGDLHDIGKNLVTMMLESGGMEIFDLGVDLDPSAFVQAIREKEVQVVCLSALLTTTMPMMKETIDAITEAGLRDQVKILIGGAPVSQEFADEIGADGFAPDAGSAGKIAKTLIH